jgi:hypothetical protein
LLAGLVGIPVLLAFLVRRKREVVRVPSTLLFRAVAVSRAKNRRIRSLVRVVALLACLGAVFALAVAAARPIGAQTGSTVAIVVDVSASMGEGEDDGAIDEARAVVSRLLRARGATDRYAIIAAGETPRCLAGPTSDEALLDEAVDALEAEDGTADLGGAIDLGVQLVRGWSLSRVIVVSDGGAAGGDPARDTGGVPVVRHVVGERGDNVGITTLASRPPEDALDASEREVLVGVATSSDAERAVEVELAAEGVTLGRHRVAVMPGEEAEARFRVHLARGEITARVAPADGRDDALSRDDAATLVARPPLPPRALLVASSEGAEADSFFARAALESAGVREVLSVAPDAVHAEAEPEDVVVVLGEGPSRHVDAPTLFLATTSGATPVSGTRELLAEREETSLRSIESRHSVLRGVALDGIEIDRAVAVTVPNDGRALVDLDGGTVVATGGVGRGKWVFVGIDPRRSDLVLRVAFPVLVANALATLRGVDAVAIAETIPRPEVEMRRAEEPPAGIELDVPSFALPVTPSTLLALFAALLLLGELLAWRKGWA